MTDEIKSKIYNRGNEKESSWPSDYGEGERGVFVLDRESKELVPIHLVIEEKKESHYVIPDEMAPTESMVDASRKIFTSRSKYYDHLRENGYIDCPVSQRPKEERPKTSKKEMYELVEKAHMDVKYGRHPFTEKQRELHKEEERKWKR